MNVTRENTPRRWLIRRVQNLANKLFPVCLSEDNSREEMYSLLSNENATEIDYIWKQQNNYQYWKLSKRMKMRL